MSLMCDDIHAAVRDLRGKGIQGKGEPEDHGYGITVRIQQVSDDVLRVEEGSL